MEFLDFYTGRAFDAYKYLGAHAGAGGTVLRPGTASVVRALGGYRFGDGDWMRARTDCKAGPLNIYEVHAGSFKKPGEAPDDWYTYRELAAQLVPYVKRQGYNYIELMPSTRATNRGATKPPAFSARPRATARWTT